MKILTEKRCIIGEGPIWNDEENTLYFTNGMGKEICKYNFETHKMTSMSLDKDCAAIAFDKYGRMIVSRQDGIFILNSDGSKTDIYDTSRYCINYANDMKAGPDGRLYVGTQSEKRVGISNKLDGKLYSIDKDGNVNVLIDGMSLSNGMDWSIDEHFFYHTDSDTEVIKEYYFDKVKGGIEYSGRQIHVDGVDGFSIDRSNKIFAACWGKGHVAVIDTSLMQVCEYINIPCGVPASCCFAGSEMNILAVTTAGFGVDINIDKYAGCTVIAKREIGGRKPYLFG